MNTIDRIHGPAIKTIKNLHFPGFETLILDNGITLYILTGGTQDIFKLELIFNAGRKFEIKRGVARMCNILMKEGVEGLNAIQLAEYWDFYGAILKSYCDLDVAGHSILGMTKHLDGLLNQWMSIINAPSFDDQEVSIHRKLIAEKLKIELSKNDVLSYRLFTAMIYGEDHPYGYNTEPEDYQNLSAIDLKDYYEKFYHANNATAIVSGKLNKSQIDSVIKYLSTIRGGNEQQHGSVYDTNEFPKDSRNHIISEQDMQISLKMGSVCVDNHHPDYPGYSTLIQIFGGYFGSRLMSSLREQKGLCYNIYATIEKMVQSNYLFISADLNAEKLDEAIKGIETEMSLLHSELISEDELYMVKNYMKGNVLSAMDGPIRSSEILKSYISQSLPFDYFRIFIDELESISPKKLRDLANKYLNMDKMTILTVGPADL